MKKTALLLALVMCITSVEAVRADSTQSYDDYTACLEENLNQKYTLDEALEIIENESSLDSYVGEIFEDVDNFDSMVFTSCGDINDIHLNNEQLIYVIDYGIVEDEIQVMSRADEYTEYQVLEGDKVDTIVYYNNGTVYLNDELLKKYGIFDVAYVNELKKVYSQEDFRLMGAYEIDYLLIVMTVTMLCERYSLTI